MLSQDAMQVTKTISQDAMQVTKTISQDAMQVTRTIKTLFREWDRNRSGSISRDELRAVIWKLGPFNSNDVEFLLAEADLNNDGEIDYDEFVNFIMKPAAKVQFTSDALGFFDAEASFRPLFEVYDYDRNGTISMEEFKECHQILLKALEDFPLATGVANDGKSRRRSLIHESATTNFQAANISHSGRISLQEFAQWQREVIKDCGLTGQQLTDFVGDLAQAMLSILSLTRKRLPANRDDNNLKALYASLSSCAKKFYRDPADPEAWTRFSAGSRVGYNNLWEPPPPAMDVKDLLRVHMSHVPVRTKTVKELVVHAELIVPEFRNSEPSGNFENARRWFAKVLQTSVIFGRPPITNTKSFHYVYAADTEGWVVLKNRECRLFSEAVQNLAPEFRILALLYRESNFKQQLSWAAVRHALNDGVEMGLLTQDEYEAYDKRVSDVFHKTMSDELVMDDYEELCPVCFEQYPGRFCTHIEVDPVHQERVDDLAYDLELRLLDVMSDLTELGIVRAWSE